MQEYLNPTKTWGSRYAGVLWARPVAYFSAEFGIHESVPIYSGGLGVLAGDHIKSASDLEHSADRHRPVLQPGLFPPAARIRPAGRRKTTSTSTTAALPMKPALGPDGPAGDRCRIETRTGTISARVWKLAVGRNTLLLLDSDVEGNQPEDRELTARLYGGDQRRADPPGIAAGRRRRAGPAGPADRRRACCISTKGTARSPRWRWCGSG